MLSTGVVSALGNMDEEPGLGKTEWKSLCTIFFFFYQAVDENGDKDSSDEGILGIGVDGDVRREDRR